MHVFTANEPDARCGRLECRPEPMQAPRRGRKVLRSAVPGVLGAAVLLALAWAEPGSTADELGNIEALPMPETVVVPKHPSGVPVVPAEPDAVHLPPVVPDNAVSIGNVVLPVPVAPDRPPSTNGTRPEAERFLPSVNATRPFDVLPARNATVPASYTPLRNATVGLPVAPREAVPRPEGTLPVGLTPADFLPRTDAETAALASRTPEKPRPPTRPEGKPAPEPRPENRPPRSGEPLRIPEEAKKTGRVDFMQGCWVGNRPEYHTQRLITERFCFDANGTGKRFILDPAHAGRCTGAARVMLHRDGVLRIVSERGHCSNGEEWGRADMVCRGEGRNTPCSWVFRDVNSRAQQAHTITFVRE